MSVINATPLLAAAGGDYQISRSVRLRSSASASFSRTVGTPTNKDVWTISGWVKYSAGGKLFPLFYALAGGYYEFLEINASGDFYWVTRNASGSAFKQYYVAAGQRLFRDPSAWYHFVVRKTSALTLQFYVNGEEFSLTAQTVGSPSSALNTASTLHYLGHQAFNADYADGYLTEINFIDGQALTPSSFGETDAITGVWKPKKYAGTYGTNGFYLNFSDNSAATATTIGKDYSGNGNNWTPNNISVTAGATYDSMIDVPTLYADGGNGRGNYCTWNPLDIESTASLNSGNLQGTHTSSGAYVSGIKATQWISSGKWYAEFVGADYFGITAMTDKPNSSQNIYASALTYTYVSNGNKQNNNAQTAYGASWSTTDVIGVAFDADAGTLTFYKNGTTQGTAFTGLSGSFTFCSMGAASKTITGNFGQRPFAYTPPTGFKALNTQNLPAPTILKGNQYFNATTYTGNGTTTGNTQAISNAVNGVSFQPDLVWIKSRSSGTQFHMWNDSVRGTNKLIYSNSTGAEDSLSNVFSSFNSDGFTVAYNSTYSQAVTNLNGSTYVAWQWKANGSAVTNTSGSITSQVNAGTSQGFSVVTYTGTGANATVGHGLGVAPKMIITKPRSNGTDGWLVYHADLGNTKYLFLETTAASGTSSGAWNNTSPTSSVFSVGTFNRSNGSGYSMVAYCFSEVAGFSKFGSYTGNGSADGPFVFCGFRPKFILVKRTDSTSWWTIFDTSRNPSNATNLQLNANVSDAEYSTVNIDVLSNGFKMRQVFDAGNAASGSTHIFAAFAESPFKNSLAR